MTKVFLEDIELFDHAVQLRDNPTDAYTYTVENAGATFTISRTDIATLNYTVAIDAAAGGSVEAVYKFSATQNISFLVNSTSSSMRLVNGSEIQLAVNDSTSGDSASLLLKSQTGAADIGFSVDASNVNAYGWKLPITNPASGQFLTMGAANRLLGKTIATTDFPAHGAVSNLWGSLSGSSANVEVPAERGLTIGATGIGLDPAPTTVDAWWITGINDYRLTGVTATPVMTADSTSLSTIYMTPYTGDRIALYSGSVWKLFQPGEKSLAVTGRTTDLPFDIFAYDNAGTVTLEFLNWSTATARATGLSRQDGVWCKTGDLTRRYLGTCRPRSATTFHWVTAGTDAPCKFDLWNAANRVAIAYALKASTNTWNYTTATWRQAQGSTNYQVDIVTGLQESSFTGVLVVTASNSAANIRRAVSIGFDATATPAGVYCADTNAAAYIGAITASNNHRPAIGRHFYAWLEFSVATGTNTFYGDNGGDTMQSGMTGTWTC